MLVNHLCLDSLLSSVLHHSLPKCRSAEVQLRRRAEVHYPTRLVGGKTYPSEKYVSQLGLSFPIYGEKPYSKPPTSDDKPWLTIINHHYPIHFTNVPNHWYVLHQEWGAKIWNPHVIFLGQQENLQFFLMNLNEIHVKSLFLMANPLPQLTCTFLLVELNLDPQNWRPRREPQKPHLATLLYNITIGQWLGLW